MVESGVGEGVLDICSEETNKGKLDVVYFAFILYRPKIEIYLFKGLKLYTKCH